VISQAQDRLLPRLYVRCASAAPFHSSRMASSALDTAESPTAPSREAMDSSCATEPTSPSDNGELTTAVTFAELGASDAIPPLAESWREQPLPQDERDKTRRILEACRDRDLDVLRELAVSEGGLVEDEIRRTACMQFHVGCQHNKGATLKPHTRTFAELFARANPVGLRGPPTSSGACRLDRLANASR
jgi:hypothetical protein